MIYNLVGFNCYHDMRDPRFPYLSPRRKPTDKNWDDLQSTVHFNPCTVVIVPSFSQQKEQLKIYGLRDKI